MATKKDDTSTDEQTFLRVMLRRAGGSRFDVHQGEVDACEDEGIGEVEVVREEHDPDAAEAGQTLYVLKQKA